MPAGNGNPAVLTGCYVPMSRYMISGFMRNKIRSVLGSSQI